MPKIVNKLPKTLRTVSLSDLQPFQGNIKHIEPDNLARLIESIKRLGFIMPVFLWRNNILDGHQRKIALEALQAEGWTLEGGVPVIDIEAKDEKEAKTMLLTYVSQYADVMRDELSDWVKEAGLSALDLSEFTNLPLDIPMADEVKPDDYTVDANIEPRAKPGDLWQLGDHRLYVGDSTKPESWEKLMQGERAQMVFTDPPYNVDYHSASKELAKGGKSSIKNDKMDAAAFRAFLTDWAIAMRANLKEDAGVYVCYSSSEHINFEESLKAAGFAVKAQIIWVKTVASMGWGDYRWRHEPILYCSIGGKRAYFDGDRIHTTVMGDKEGRIQVAEGGEISLTLDGAAYEIEGKDIKVKRVMDGKTTIWHEKRETGYEHPTQKPVELVKRAILNSSRKGDIVVDSFGGSGSTLITCEKTGRRCATMELDPQFATVIIDRWEKLTEKKAKRLIK